MTVASKYAWEFLVEPTLQERAIDVFITHCKAEKGLTCFEAAKRMGVQVNQISGRYIDLQPDYLIITGWKEYDWSTRVHSIYVLTERGKRLKKALRELDLL